MNLAELIRRSKGDRSYAELERDSRGALGAKRWQQIATQGLRTFPEPSTLQGMAVALGVPVRLVVVAAAESLNLDMSEPRSTLASLLPPSAETLDEKEIAAVLSIVTAIASRPQPNVFVSFQADAERIRDRIRELGGDPDDVLQVRDGRVVIGNDVDEAGKVADLGERRKRPRNPAPGPPPGMDPREWAGDPDYFREQLEKDENWAAHDSDDEPDGSPY